MIFCCALLGRYKAEKETQSLVEQQFCKPNKKFYESLQEEVNQAINEVCKTQYFICITLHL